MVEQLGEGGMAAVYRAFDQRLQVWRAIKVLLPQFADKPKIARRFEAEAQTMALLEHRHIVRVYDVGNDGTNIAYIVMELVEGGCLVDWLDRHGAMPPRMAVRATQEVCLGLSAAHDKGVIHRDIKPHNVMVTAEGVCRVTDFGIARVGDSQNSQTKTGSVMGTWGYMAPEQRTNAKGVDERGDVYAVGATLYTLLTDRMPMDLFAAERNAAILEGVQEELIPVLVKSTEYDREDRYSSVMELHAALDEVYARLPEDPPETPPLALHGAKTLVPPDPTHFVPATEIGEGGVPVANPTLMPKGTPEPAPRTMIPGEGDSMTGQPVTRELGPEDTWDPAKSPDPRHDLGSAETIVRPEADMSIPISTPAPAERPSSGSTHAMVTGAAMAVWGILGLVLLLGIVIVVAYFAFLRPPPEAPTAPVVTQPAPPDPVKPEPAEPKPAPEQPKPVEPAPATPKPKPTTPKPVVPKPAEPAPVVAPVPVPPPVPEPPPEPEVVKCLKLASPVAWNGSKSGVKFGFKPCEGSASTEHRVVLHYRVKGGGSYQGHKLGVALGRFTWLLPGDVVTGPIEWYVDGDLGNMGSSSAPNVFTP